ncbi:MAG: hypothetical protein JSV43_09030 [Methanobacteriota archaeon]|nr:MAG: hypothetical protein JSV43_09030 [Euryarchaeota archaeon]
MSVERSKFCAYLITVALVMTAAATVVPVPVGVPEPPSQKGFDVVDNPNYGPRNLLVVLMDFSDLPTDVPAQFIEDQMFGPRPSLNDYYKETSYNQFWFVNKGHFSWVQAWDDPSTPSDDESTWAYWEVFGATDPYYGGSLLWHSIVSLDKAGYDFAPLDENNDGKISLGKELAYHTVISQEPNRRGGIKRPMPVAPLDGKIVEGPGCGSTEDDPWITLYAHELAHQTLGLGDYYTILPQSINQFSLMGVSAFTNASGGWQYPNGPHHLDPFSKLKLGWHSGTVVSTDGFYNIQDVETHQEFYILHNPANGKKEYYLVENRWKGTSYDDTRNLIDALVPPLPPADAPASIPDEGLLIWHIDENRDWDGTLTGNIPKVNLTRRENKDKKAAFNGDDPGYYDFWDGSSPRSAKWNDGSNSKVGVWCVGDAGPTVRAWLDVPGPGILVCPKVDSTSAIPGSPGIITVQLVNTGDSTDTFSMTAGGMAGDLVVSLPGPITLGPKGSTTIDIPVTPIRDCTTSPGLRLMTITAESITNPAVSTTILATVDVLPFGEPHVTLSPNYAETYPDATVTYSVQLTNEGNVFDTMSLSFTGIDFGSAYMAYPTAIPESWVSFSPVDPSAPACGSTSSILSISVPWDWAAMEDALYEFTATATSSITPDTGTDSGQLLVHATPLSMMFWVKAEIQQLLDDVDALPPSDVRDGLHDKAEASLNKVTQAMDRYLLGDDPPTSNHFRTTQNILRAFIHLLDAQRGKALTVAQANDFEAQVSLIISHIDTILSEI